MFKAARIAKIKEVLLDRGQVDVATLSSLLNVSEVTVRSDLDLLEQERYIIRTHGGAILNSDVFNQQEEITLLFQIKYDRNKEYIGNIAADMVTGDEWIFIGQGATCYYVAHALGKKPHINVITNSLLAAAVLTQNSGAQIILTGGELAHDSLYTTGNLFMNSFDNIFISKAFVEVAGVGFGSGFTVSNVSELAMFNRVKEVSSEIVIVADSSKFGKTAFCKIGDLDCAGTIITNEDIDEKFKSYFFEHNIKLFTSYRIKNSSVGTGE